MERFWSKVDKSGDCWLWTAGCFDSGYGAFQVSGKCVRAHKFSYELARGPVPVGRQLDHLCRNVRCVRPDHLEAVTARVDVLRSHGIAARNALKTHCDVGHVFDLANIYSPANGRGWRACRACRAEATLRYRARLRMATHQLRPAA